MSSSITLYGASFVLNVLFGRRDLPPEAYYLALLTQAPGTQTDGSLITEPDADDGYARVIMLNDVMSWGGAVDGVVASTAQIVFPVASGTWPVITHYAVCDSLTGGQVYLYGSFNIPRRVMNGDQARIPAQALSLSVASLSTALSSTF